MDLEERIRAIGRRLYEASIRSTPSIFDKRRWKGRMMEWAMRDEVFKTKLFHFVDLLPALKEDALVVRLLKEYFLDGPSSSYFVRMGIKWLPESLPFSTLVAKLVRANVRGLARQFIGGEKDEEIEEAVSSLRRSGFAFSVDILGETVVSEREADSYKDRYIRLLDRLHERRGEWPPNPLLDRDDRGPVPTIDLSVKVSSFYSQLDPMDWEGSIQKTRDRLRPLFERARDLSASITFDMEHYYYKDLTIALFKELLEEEGLEGVFGGIAIQAYLRDSRRDLEGLISWAKEKKRRVMVRLVKGAYWDYEVAINRQRGWSIPVFLEKEETDHNYEELTRLLLENISSVRPAFATHNIRSISNAIAIAEELGIPEGAIEFQMLYGMAEPVREAVRGLGYRVRIYVPVGDLIPGMAYLIRRLLENTSNESFLRRSFFERMPFDTLMARPTPKGAKDSKTEGTNPLAFHNEPPIDFSKAINRQKMIEGLERIRKRFGKEYPLYIGGESIIKEGKIPSVNPSRPEEVVGVVSKGSKEEAERAVEEAKKAWKEWRKVPAEERASYLFKVAERMRKERFDLIALMVYEVGKSWKEADGDVAEAIDYLEYYGREMVRLSREVRVASYPGESNEYIYEPKGIGVVISPWNFPLAIPTGMVSAGIVTGNCVIFKPSSLAPVTGWQLAEFFRDVGLPCGVLQFLPGSGEEVGEHLIAHPEIDFIAFTGSMDVGLKIVESSAKVRPGQKGVKRVIAEMGGKNAIIVDETADMDEAIKGIVGSALGYQGQKCSACSRVILVGEIDGFLDRLKEAMASVRIGPPEDPGNFMGPLIDDKAVGKVKGYIDRGLKEGRPLLVKEVKGEGYFIGPAIFIDIDPYSSLAQEEIFGPLIVILRAKDIDEAIEIANSTPYALTGGLYSRSPKNIRKVKEGFMVGNLYINRKITGALVGRQPFGGFGMSGIGSKAGGPDYLIQFMNPRSISENTMRRGFIPKI